MVTEPRRRLFDVDEFHRMGEAGILREEPRVELVHGEIIERPPIGPEHLGRVNRLNRVLVTRLAGRAVISPQNPLLLGRRSEPQPDIVVLRPRDDDYMTRLPRTEDVLLVIEVADSSFAYDRIVKRELYGSAGLPEYWLLDVNGRALEVYRGPCPAGYTTYERLLAGQSVGPEAFPDCVLDVGEIVG